MSDGEVVALEAAEAEFDKFVKLMDLDVDPAHMDEEDKKSFAESKHRIIEAIQDGRLFVDEQGQPHFTPRSGDGGEIVFYEPTGATLLSLDKIKSNHDQQRGFAALADMTRQNPSRFANMKMRDLKVCQAVFVLFLGG